MMLEDEIPVTNYVKEVLKLKKREHQKANNKITYRDKVADKKNCKKIKQI